jgi:hypothetical protein
MLGILAMPKTSIAVFNVVICAFTLGILDIPIPTCAAATRTAADDAAFSEQIKANAEMDFIHQVFEKEGYRLTGGSNAPASPDVAKLFDSTVKHPALGDTRVPLHLRLVERERLAFVSGIQMIKASLGAPCEEQVADVSQFGDPVKRTQELRRIQCQRTRRDRYQRGTHSEGLAREKTIFELKLPPYTQVDMLTEQRARNRSQDVELAATFKSAEALDSAIEQFVHFLDAHAQSVHVVNGVFVFENEADAATFNDLQGVVGKSQKRVNQSP